MTIGHNSIPKAVHDATEFNRVFPEKIRKASRDKVISDANQKIIFSQLFLRAEGSIEQRKAIAYTQKEYAEAVEKYANAAAEVDGLYAEHSGKEWDLKLYQTHSRNERGG